MMPVNHLHIVSFNVPFPADYGGVIDVFYKLKALAKLQIKIHLHCFEYGREQQKALNEICETVDYYPRQTNWKKGLSLNPYIIQSRISETLIQRLTQDDYPILFEGIHTCGICMDKRLAKRKKIFRPANVEHQYYSNLAEAEERFLKKAYFRTEAFKLERFEKKLPSVSLILAISEADQAYFRSLYPQTKVEHIPAFHAHSSIKSKTGTGDYALYHGNLSVPENNEAALFLIDEIFSQIDYPLIISGHAPSLQLREKCKPHQHIRIVENPDDENLFQLIQQAHIHTLPTFRASGLKLKLLHTLFNGRHVIVNEEMIVGTSVEDTCNIAYDKNGWVTYLQMLAETPFTEADLEIRKKVMLPRYQNTANAEKIKHLIFDT